ncbi:MAG TPA: hypothetical protein VFO81_08030 [Gaiellaceae bacterium]|nr:hypothetical protein [Gaiellaceae bacterium]
MRALLPALALAAAVAGCAGGGERLSREEFVEQATAICSRAEERVGALVQPENVEEVETYAREARAITEEGVSDLRELEPPEELEDGFERYLEQADEVVALLGELERSAAAGDEAEARRLSARIADAADAQAAARAAGIPACEQAAT